MVLLSRLAAVSPASDKEITGSRSLIPQLHLKVKGPVWPQFELGSGAFAGTEVPDERLRPHQGPCKAEPWQGLLTS